MIALKTRNRITIASIVLFIMISKIPSAQTIVMPAKMSTPRGTITVPNYIRLPQYRRYASGVVNRTHHFTIVFLNDNTMEVKGRINLSDSSHYVEWGKKEEGHRIFPSQTKEIFRVEAGGRKISGMAKDSCWLFPVETGKINTYSITSETDAPMVSFIQKGESGPLVFLVSENLSEMVMDNEKALKFVSKDKLLKAIKVYNKSE